MQNYWNLDLNVNGDSLPGPLIIGTFEKRAPGTGWSAVPLEMETDKWKLVSGKS